MSIEWNVVRRERIKGLKDLRDNKLLHDIRTFIQRCSGQTICNFAFLNL